ACLRQHQPSRLCAAGYILREFNRASGSGDDPDRPWHQYQRSLYRGGSSRGSHAYARHRRNGRTMGYGSPFERSGFVLRAGFAGASRARRLYRRVPDPVGNVPRPPCHGRRGCLWRSRDNFLCASFRTVCIPGPEPPFMAVAGSGFSRRTDTRRDDRLAALSGPLPATRVSHFRASRQPPSLALEISAWRSVMTAANVLALLPLLLIAGTSVVVLVAVAVGRNHAVAFGLTLTGLAAGFCSIFFI